MSATVRIFRPDPFDSAPPAGPATKTTTVRAIVDAFLKRSEAEGHYVAEALDERKRALADFADFMANVDQADWSPDHVLDWIAGHESWATPSTRKGKNQQVQACFNWAAGKGKRRNPKPMISANPFSGISFEESDPRRPMTEAEFRSLLRESRDPGFRRFLMFLWLTGCRAGEARQIVWDEIDWESGVIVKQKHKTKKKTKKARIIYLVQPLIDMLKGMRKKNPAATGEIFRNERGGRWRRQTLDTKILRMRRKLGLADDLVLHCTRHAFGTRNAKKSGGNLKLVSLAMGHSSVATTERYYLHNDKMTDAIREEISGNPGW